ncbi:MAG TPA: lysophospholipid acyltransferase family protein [Longimicrobium sp.]
MIRTVWFGLTALGMTLFWGPAVLFAAAFGLRDEDWYMDVVRLWARTVMRASGCRVVLHHPERVAPGEPRVIVSNHVSWFDVFALAASLPGRFHFVAKKELLKIPVFGPAMRAAGHITIDRSNRERAIESLREAGERIRRSPAVVVVYAEGTRSRDGRLQPFKKGAFMLAIESRVPIVPLAVAGSYEIMPKGSWRIRPNTIHLHFLEPVPAAEVAAAASLGVEPLMERVRMAIASVVGDLEPALPPSR